MHFKDSLQTLTNDFQFLLASHRGHFWGRFWLLFTWIILNQYSNPENHIWQTNIFPALRNNFIFQPEWYSMAWYVRHSPTVVRSPSSITSSLHVAHQILRGHNPLWRGNKAIYQRCASLPLGPLRSGVRKPSLVCTTLPLSTLEVLRGHAKSISLPKSEVLDPPPP